MKAFGVDRFALVAAVFVVTLHLCPAEERQQHETDGVGGGGFVVVVHHQQQQQQQQQHRLRHRYRSTGAARDFRDLHPHGLGVCSRCPPGFGVARRCTLVRDTVCHSCPTGYYAPGYSRKHSCWPCSRCGNGLYEARPCTGTSDTICDACPDLPASRASPASSHHTSSSAPSDAHGCRHLSDNNSSRHNNNNKGVAAPLTDANKSHRTRADDDADDDEDDDADDGTVDPSSDTLRAPPPPPNGNTSETLPLPPTPTISSSYSFADATTTTSDDDVAVGVTQIVAFQIVLIFTTVAAILALTCRLRVFTSHEAARFKIPESYRRDDGVALIEHLSGDS